MMSCVILARGSLVPRPLPDFYITSTRDVSGLNCDARVILQPWRNLNRQCSVFPCQFVHKRGQCACVEGCVMYVHAWKGQLLQFWGSFSCTDCRSVCIFTPEGCSLCASEIFGHCERYGSARKLQFMLCHAWSVRIRRRLCNACPC